MPQNTGTLVAAPIVTPASEDTYPTHFANLGKGGLHHAANTVERDNISVERRQIGMLCAVENDGLYMLEPDLVTWVAVAYAGGIPVGSTWTVAYNDATPAMGFVIAANSRLVTVSCEVIEAFDGVGASITLGILGDPESIFPLGSIELDQADALFEVGSTLQGPVVLIATITPGAGATQGIVRFQTQLTGV